MARREGEAAVPPNRLSRRTEFRFGVHKVGSHGYIAAVRLKKPGEEDTVWWEEHLGAHSTPWYAAVCHDAALCKRAYEGGSLGTLQHGSGSGAAGGTERLNFPLSAYTSQQDFWDALKHNSFGELSLQLQANNRLEKTLFFGDSWVEGLAEQQELEQQPKKREPDLKAAARSGSRKEGHREHEHPREHALLAAKTSRQEKEPDQKRQRLTPPAQGVAERRGELLPTAATSQQQQQKEAPPAPPPRPTSPAGGSSDGGDGRHEAIAAGGAHLAPSALPIAAPAEPPSGRSSGESEVLAQRAGKMPAAAAGVSSSSSDSDRGSDSESEPVVVRNGGKRMLATARASSPAPPALTTAERTVVHQQPHAEQQQQRPTEEPKNVWIGGKAEFPPGSATYPMYLKQGPIQRHYYTISQSAGGALFQPGYEGEVDLKDVATGRTWTVHTNLKNGTQRYLTKVGAFNKDNAVKAHDVLWFKSADAASGVQPQQQRACLLFGIWPWDSQEAAAFTAKLNSGGKSDKKASGLIAGSKARSTAAELTASKLQQQQQEQQQQQQQQPARQDGRHSSSSDDSMPLLQRPSAMSGSAAKPSQAHQGAASDAAVNEHRLLSARKATLQRPQRPGSVSKAEPAAQRSLSPSKRAAADQAARELLEESGDDD